MFHSTPGGTLLGDGTQISSGLGRGVTVLMNFSTGQDVPLGSGQTRVSVPMTATGEVVLQDFTTNEVTSRFSLLGAGTATAVSFPPGGFPPRSPDESSLFPQAMRLTYDFAPIPEPSTWLLLVSGIAVLTGLKTGVLPTIFTRRHIPDVRAHPDFRVVTQASP